MTDSPREPLLDDLEPSADELEQAAERSELHRRRIEIPVAEEHRAVNLEVLIVAAIDRVEIFAANAVQSVNIAAGAIGFSSLAKPPQAGSLSGTRASERWWLRTLRWVCPWGSRRSGRPC